MEDQHKEVNPVTCVGNSWVVCKSRSRPGFNYYFNTVNGQSLWNLNNAEVVKAKQNTKILEGQPGNELERFPEPKDQPPNYYPSQTRHSPMHSNIYNEQMINNQFPKQQYTIIQPDATTGSFINPINSFNVLPFHASQTVNPVVCQQTSQRFFFITPPVVPLTNQVQASPLISQSQPSLAFGFNNVQESLHRNNITVPRMVQSCRGVTKQRPQNNNRKLGPKQGYFGQQRINSWNKKDLREWLETKRSLDKTLNIDNEETDNAVDEPYDCDETAPNASFQRIENYQEESTKIDMTPLRNLSPCDAKLDCWFIVADTTVILRNFNYLNNLTDSDETCHLMLPKHVMSQLMTTARNTGNVNTNARRIVRFLSQQIDCGYAFLADDSLYATDNDTTNILNTCIKLVQQNYYVVLISDSKELLESQNTTRIPIYTIQELKRMLKRGTLKVLNKTRLVPKPMIKLTVPNNLIANKMTSHNSIVVREFNSKGNITATEAYTSDIARIKEITIETINPDAIKPTVETGVQTDPPEQKSNNNNQFDNTHNISNTVNGISATDRSASNHDANHPYNIDTPGKTRIKMKRSASNLNPDSIKPTLETGLQSDTAEQRSNNNNKFDNTDKKCYIVNCISATDRSASNHDANHPYNIDTPGKTTIKLKRSVSYLNPDSIKPTVETGVQTDTPEQRSNNNNKFDNTKNKTKTVNAISATDLSASNHDANHPYNIDTPGKTTIKLKRSVSYLNPDSIIPTVETGVRTDTPEQRSNNNNKFDNTDNKTKTVNAISATDHSASNHDANQPYNIDTSGKTTIKLKRSASKLIPLDNEVSSERKRYKWRNKRKNDTVVTETKEPFISTSSTVPSNSEHQNQKQPEESLHDNVDNTNIENMIEEQSVNLSCRTSKCGCDDTKSGSSFVINSIVSTQIVKEDSSTTGGTSRLERNNENMYNEVTATPKCSFIMENRNNAIRKNVIIEIDGESMEEYLTMRLDEWISRFIQIMEEVLTQVLQRDPPFASKEFPPPWTLHEATHCVIKKFSSCFYVVDAANQLSVVLFELGAGKGMISKNMTAAEFMEMYSYGVYLVQSLQDLYKDCEDLQTAADSLNRILIDIKNPNMDCCHNYMFTEGLHEPCLDVMKTTNTEEKTERPRSINESLKSKSSIQQDDDVKANTSPNNNLLSSGLDQHEEIPQEPDNKKTFLSNLELQKKVATCNSNEPQGSAEIVHNVNPVENVADTTDNVTHEPRVVRQFIKFSAFEERLRNREESSDLDYESDENCDLTHSYEEDIIESELMYDDYDRVSSVKTVQTDVDGHRKFRFWMGMILKQVIDTFRETKTFCEKSIDLLRAPNQSKVIKLDIRRKAEKARTAIITLSQSLDSILKRDTDNPENNISNIIKRAGIDISIEQNLLAEYSLFLSKILSKILCKPGLRNIVATFKDQAVEIQAIIKLIITSAYG